MADDLVNLAGGLIGLAIVAKVADNLTDDDRNYRRKKKKRRNEEMKK